MKNNTTNDDICQHNNRPEFYVLAGPGLWKGEAGIYCKSCLFHGRLLGAGGREDFTVRILPNAKKIKYTRDLVCKGCSEEKEYQKDLREKRENHQHVVPYSMKWHRLALELVKSCMDIEVGVCEQCGYPTFGSCENCGVDPYETTSNSYDRDTGAPNDLASELKLQEQQEALVAKKTRDTLNRLIWDTRK